MDWPAVLCFPTAFHTTEVNMRSEMVKWDVYNGISDI